MLPHKSQLFSCSRNIQPQNKAFLISAKIEPIRYVLRELFRFISLSLIIWFKANLGYVNSLTSPPSNILITFVFPFNWQSPSLCQPFCCWVLLVSSFLYQRIVTLLWLLAWILFFFFEHLIPYSCWQARLVWVTLLWEYFLKILALLQDLSQCET